MLNILLHSIGGIESAVHICQYLTTSAHLTVQQHLENADVMSQLQYTKAILHQIKNKYQKLIHTEPGHPVVVCITGVMDSLHSICHDLKDIQNIHNEHKQKWFHQWFSPSCTQPIEQLDRHLVIHNLRMRRLMNVLPIIDTLVSNDVDEVGEEGGESGQLNGFRRHSV